MKLSDFLTERDRDDIVLPVRQLSASSIKMLDKCEEQFRQRYVLGKKTPPGAALIVGNAFHEAVEHDFRLKIADGVLPHVDGVLERYHDRFDREVEQAGGVGEVVWDKKEKPATARNNGELVTKLYHERVAPRMQPEHVEHEFEVDVDVNSKPIRVVGKIDFIGTQAESDFKYQVAKEAAGVTRFQTDYKTSNRAKYKLEPDWILQGRIYQYSNGLPVEWQVAVKGSKPNVITSTDAPGLYQWVEKGNRAFVERTVRHAVLKLSWLYQTFGPDETWPTTGFSHPWACGYCGYKPDCAAWRTP